MTSSQSRFFSQQSYYKGWRGIRGGNEFWDSITTDQKINNRKKVKGYFLFIIAIRRESAFRLYVTNDTGYLFIVVNKEAVFLSIYFETNTYWIKSSRIIFVAIYSRYI